MPLGCHIESAGETLDLLRGAFIFCYISRGDLAGPQNTFIENSIQENQSLLCAKQNG